MGMQKVGRLEQGWAADLQLIDANLPTPLAEHNLYEQLLLWRNHNHVSDVMVNGQWRVRDGIVLGTDLAQMRARVHENAWRMWEKT